MADGVAANGHQRVGRQFRDFSPGHTLFLAQRAQVHTVARRKIVNNATELRRGKATQLPIQPRE
jgi:hypothetical protein